MFHKIAPMYKYLKHQDYLQASLSIQNLKSRKYSSTPQLYQPTEPSFPFEIQVVPSDLQDIQPHPLQVWNCGDFGFDPNGNWKNMVCMYNFSHITGYGGPRLVRDHHYGAQRSYLPVLVEYF